jgi:hypothetical protein
MIQPKQTSSPQRWSLEKGGLVINPSNHFKYPLVLSTECFHRSLYMGREGALIRFQCSLYMGRGELTLKNGQNLMVKNNFSTFS